MKVISVNEKLRLYTKEQIDPVNYENISSFINKIQGNHSNFKTFLLLWFVDYIAVLRKSIIRGIASDNDFEVLQELLTIYTFEDLLAYIKKNPTFLETIIKNSIGMTKATDELRYDLLNLVDDYMTFSPTHLLELIELSKPVELPEYISKYQGDPKILKQRLLVNTKSAFVSFINNTLDMLRDYYCCMKTLQYIGVGITVLDKKLLNLIEKNDLETILNTLIKDDTLFEYLINRFMTFQIEELPVSDSMIRNYYKTHVDEKTKTKLMRLEVI